MNYLLDTCVLSDTISKQPNITVRNWLIETQPTNLFLSAVTIGELQRGIARLPFSKRQAGLQQWLNGILWDFKDHVLALDAEIAIRWAQMFAVLEKRGITCSHNDSYIAATALTHNLTVVTRNVTDFQETGVAIHNPWAG